jgi:hypothetical protein
VTVPDPDELARELLAATATLAVELHGAIAPARAAGRFPAAGHPVAVVFHQPPGERLAHRSGRPGEAALGLAFDAAAEVRRRVGYGRAEDNPLLAALALAAFYVAEGRRSGALGLGEASRGRVRAAPLAGDDARRDPVLAAGERRLRVWAPVAGHPDACVELRFG